MKSLSPCSVIARQHATHTQEQGLPGTPELLHTSIELCLKVTLKRQSQLPVSLTKWLASVPHFLYLLPFSNISICL